VHRDEVYHTFWRRAEAAMVDRSIVNGTIIVADLLRALPVDHRGATVVIAALVVGCFVVAHSVYGRMLRAKGSEAHRDAVRQAARPAPRSVTRRTPEVVRCRLRPCTGTRTTAIDVMATGT
jgi:hypothetical protein